MVKAPTTVAGLADTTVFQCNAMSTAALYGSDGPDAQPVTTLNTLQRPQAECPLGTPNTHQPFAAAAASSGQAHAKVILFGEHSVVYGYPAIALPLFDLRMRAQAWHIPGDDVWFESDYYTGSLLNAPDYMAAPRKAVQATVEHVGGRMAGMHVCVRGTIPLGRGLGSSAAAAGAIVEAVARLHGVELSETERFDLVQAAEKVAHGKASGLDAYATTAPYPIRFHQGLATALVARINAILIIADTGVHGSTRQAVDLVRALRERFRRKIDRVLEELGTLAELAIEDLAHNRASDLGCRMDRAQELLTQLKISHPSIDRLISAARKAGALGAKLTGAGLGGCVIALAHPEKAEAIAQALTEAGATQVWQLSRWGTAA